MEDRMLSVREVVERVGLHRSTIWKKIRAGGFPAPIELCENKIGWPASEISTWLANRPRRTYTTETAPETGAVA